MHRCFQDDLPTVGISRLVASGAVSRDAAHALVMLAGVEREVRIVRRKFPNSGEWALFLCAECGRRARTLKLIDGKPMCWRCCRDRGAVYRTAGGSVAERADGHLRRVGALIEMLDGPPLRLQPRPGRILDRRTRLATTLQKSLISARRAALARQRRTEPWPSAR
jgi:hypothetical protein